MALAITITAIATGATAVTTTAAAKVATNGAHSLRRRDLKVADTDGSKFDDRFPAPITSSSQDSASTTAPLLVSSSHSNDAPLGVSTVVGIALAVLAGVLLVLGAAFWYYRKRRLQRLVTSKKDFDLDAVETPYTADTYSGYFKSDPHSDEDNDDQSVLDNATVAPSTSSSTEAIDGVSGDQWYDDEIVALRVPLKTVETHALMSRGGYGEVYAGVYKGERVAIKMLLPHARRDMAQISAFLAETKLMAALEHPHIVRFVGVAWDSLSDLCVLSEFMEGGDLRALLTRFEQQEHRPHGFDADKIRIAFHVAHALTYLHSLQPLVLHRDLKSKNILLDRELNAKLTDFGVSRERSDTTTMTAGVGTSLWMAPEMMLGERYDEKSDIFSFGIVLSELDSHALPYAQAKSTDSGRQPPDTVLLQMVSLGRLRVELSSNAPQALVDLAAACTALDPKERPTAVDVTNRLQLALRTYENFVF